MSDPQPNFGKTDLVLNINTNPSGTSQETKIVCTITDISNKNYTLNCQSNEDIDSNNLQSAYSVINNDVLLVNFDPQNEEKGGESTGENDTTDSKINSHKSSGGLSSGGIIAIVVASIAALCAIIFIIILVKKGSTPKAKIADITNNQFSSQTNIEA